MIIHLTFLILLHYYFYFFFLYFKDLLMVKNHVKLLHYLQYQTIMNMLYLKLDIFKILLIFTNIKMYLYNDKYAFPLATINHSYHILVPHDNIQNLIMILYHFLHLKF